MGTVSLSPDQIQPVQLSLKPHGFIWLLEKIKTKQDQVSLYTKSWLLWVYIHLFLQMDIYVSVWAWQRRYFFFLLILGKKYKTFACQKQDEVIQLEPAFVNFNLGTVSLRI